MDKEKKFCLIGRTLKHSYSKIIHNKLGDYVYDLVELEPNEVEDFVKNGEYDGFNVTIPYKSEVMKHLDLIDPLAEKVGAVNTVVRRNGKLYGFNTDFDGMRYMFIRASISLKGKTVMILGSGGTSKTARAVCEYEGAKNIITVSRNGEVNYDNYKDEKNTEVIINTTPVGMYPNSYSSPIDLDGFEHLEGIADVIYNPAKTLFCFEAEKRGIKNTNGFYMLVAQAKYAMDYFFNEHTEDSKIEYIHNQILKDNQNVVLVGMPGSGKSTVGKNLAELLNKEFIDTDEEIVKKDGRDIPTIFKESGEGYFRQLEKRVVEDLGKLTGKVIATGGGVVKDKSNKFPLSSNGKIFWIKREVEKLVTMGRPLSKDLTAVKKLYEERKENYAYFSDCEIDNNCEIDKTIKGIIEKL